MSLLFDSLRRGRQDGRTKAKNRHGGDADAVLATMGYARENRGGMAQRILACLAAAAVLFAVGWFGWQWYAEGNGTFIVSGEPRTAPVETQDTQSKPVAPRSLPSSAPAATTAAARPERTTLPAPVTTSAVVPAQPATGGSSSSRRALARDAQSRAARAQVRPVSKVTQPAVKTETQVSSAPSDEFQLALYYQRAGDFDNALIQYRTLLQRDPMNAHARNNLGLLYQTKGMLAEAIVEFQRALYIDARYTRARNNLGVALLNQGNAEAAAAEFRSVLSQDARNVDAFVNLALADKAAGRAERAKETLLRALVIDQRSAPAHYNLGVLFESTGETVRAVEHYRAFLEHAGPGYTDRAPEVRARLDTLTTPRQP